jgi:hypothetical protein
VRLPLLFLFWERGQLREADEAAGQKQASQKKSDGMRIIPSDPGLMAVRPLRQLGLTLWSLEQKLKC